MLLERTQSHLNSARVEALRGKVLGTVVTPDDFDYDARRRVWNKAFLREPAVIVRAVDAVDVRHAVTFARENDLQFAIRSGGHSLAGFGSTDGGLVVDLSLLKHISIDPSTGLASVQPGVTSEELAPQAAEYGLG